MNYSQILLRCFGLVSFLILIALAPQNLASAGELQLDWTDNANNEEGFKIDRKVGTAGIFSQIGAVGANVTFYTDVNLADGVTYCYRLAAFNTAGSSTYTLEGCATARATLQRISRIGIFRPANGGWYLDNGNSVWEGCGVDDCFSFGMPGDVPVLSDYDGDGKVDAAVYGSGVWYVLRSSDSGVTAVGWGGVAQDIPAPADYDGDGKVDIAVYRFGNWCILRSSDGVQTAVGWGTLEAISRFT